MRANDTTLSKSDFYELLDSYASAFQGGFTASGNVDAEAARALLGDWIGTVVLEDMLSDYGVELDQSDRAKALESLAAQPGFAKAPEIVKEFYIRATAVRAAGADTFSPNDEELATTYNQGADESGVVCLRLILTDTRPDMDFALARIAVGESFADVARDMSKDTSGAQGGILVDTQSGRECFDYKTLSQQVVPELASAIDDAQVGTVSGPLQIPDLGWLTILLRPFSEVASQARDIIGSLTAARITTSALDAADVWVNSQYGRWDKTTHQVVALGQ